MAQKGAGLEELVRAYFALQGFFALRGVSYRFEDEEVTNIDGWLYGRQSASVRTRTLVDIKDKRSPKAFERILWARGMQLALGCDRAIVATTDGGAKIIRFAHQQKVGLLTKDFLDRLEGKLDTSGRMTLEQFIGNIQTYKDHKQDGDWLRRISDAKSALISVQGYPAFNKAIAAFGFFAERAQTRPHHKEQALRGAYLTAALACIALDSALERVVYEDQGSRYRAIADGVTYGDAGDSRVQSSITTVLEVIAKGMANGRAISRQAKDALEKMFESVRADIIAEHFTKEHNAGTLVSVAKELDDRAHSVDYTKIQVLSIDAKSVLGVFADFVQANRTVLLNGGSPKAAAGSSAKAEHGSQRVVLSGAGAVAAAGKIGAAGGGVLSGAGAVTAGGEIRAARGIALSGSGAFAVAGEIVTRAANLLLQTVIVPGERTDEGRLIEAVALPWFDIIALLQKDPNLAFALSPDKWEELIAGAYKRAGFDEVTLTPRSGDYGRDVIAVKKGLGIVRVIDQVKAYKPPHLVTANDVRALLGVLPGDGASKGFLTTTSDFAPGIKKDPLIVPFMPSRLELIDGAMLLARLQELAERH